ncbi:hypothetical protein OG883_03995 [Streptomyces sp. NBC_01142]|uniref:hypothetical protein n=1 Tax=Streptomyces sp. NBC_01142 TaxID=2975865 RepID=UPI00225B8DD4|nr:hypothetical protein [Streptomyces sp. NBC_01142]MCX4819078.1 hypothetical protein [Streptomyces sp. NBC_01142]
MTTAGSRTNLEGIAMTDIGLRAATTAKVYVTGWRDSVLDGMKSRRDKGQGAIEYVGITILVVAIVALLLQTKMGNDIANKFRESINSVLNGGGGGGGAGGAGGTGG